MVPKDSPFKTIDDLVTAWKADPGSLSVGGGSSPGGPDHLLPMQLAQAVGIDPKDGQLRVVRRRRRPAARRSSATRSTSPPPAPASSRTRSRTATSGCWRPAATSGSRASTPRRCKEAGIDLVFTNWRGVVAPPGITDAQQGSG